MFNKWIEEKIANHGVASQLPDVFLSSRFRCRSQRWIDSNTARLEKAFLSIAIIQTCFLYFLSGIAYAVVAGNLIHFPVISDDL